MAYYNKNDNYYHAEIVLINTAKMKRVESAFTIFFK